MRGLRRCFAALLCLAVSLSLVSCFFDMGEGEDENAFHDYFSGVYLLSLDGGVAKEDIALFSASISIEDEGMKEVVPHEKYAYIAFCVAGGYTLTVEDFVFYARTLGDGTELSLDFFVSDVLPTVGNGESPDEGEGNEGEEGGWEDIFTSPAYAHASFSLANEWNSTHLEFENPQTVRGGQYIVVRVNNNAMLEIPDGGLLPELSESIAFTFNYLIFRFTNVTKQ